MRLQSYLITEGRTIPIEEEAALPVIRKKCMKHVKAIKSGSRPHIYRGIRNFYENYGVVDPKSSSERKSKNTSNHMTLMMDNLPSWKAYPKRSQSIICSTDDSNAASYGRVFLCYPSDGCDIGIVQASDVWDGFQRSLGVDVPMFNRWMKNHDIADRSFSVMKGQLELFFEVKLPKSYNETYRRSDGDQGKTEKSINAMARGLATTGSGGGFIEPLFKYIYGGLWDVENGRKMPSIMKAFNNMLSPQENGFKLNNDRQMYGGRELWIGNAPIIMVSQMLWARMEKEGLY